jgi:putative protease
MPIEEDEHGTYIMNSKDLRAIEHLDELWGAGVESFKIEGRTKSIYYLSLITKAYRQAIDEMIAKKPFNPKLLDETEKTANRGFTTAFLLSASERATEKFDSPQEENLPQIYAGKVVNQRAGGWMEVEIKNRIKVGDEIECISPQSNYRFQISAMEGESGLALQLAHGGNGTVWIKTEGPIDPYALLSRVVDLPVSSSVS